MSIVGNWDSVLVLHEKRKCKTILTKCVWLDAQLFSLCWDQTNQQSLTFKINTDDILQVATHAEKNQ